MCPLHNNKTRLTNTVMIWKIIEKTLILSSSNLGCEGLAGVLIFPATDKNKCAELYL